MQNRNSKSSQQRFKPVLFCLALILTLSGRAAADGMVPIPDGDFIMGDAVDHTSHVTPHSVHVSAFQIDSNLVTHSLWQTVYNYALINNYDFSTNGLAFGEDNPVHTISWYDAVKWCNARSQMDGYRPCYYTDATLQTPFTSGKITLTSNNVDWTADGYRLPTEAEWEKAARGGLVTNRYPTGMTINHSKACYISAQVITFPGDNGPANTSPPSTVPVGSFPPNGYGLYDMAGNISEWCWDYYSSTYYSSSPASDPTGPDSGSFRIVRGGSWHSYADQLCCANRNFATASTENYTIGFRCVRAGNSSQPQSKTTPVVVTNVVASSITYGQTLGSVTASLSGTFTNVPSNGDPGTNVNGTLAFAQPTSTPNAGNANAQVIFTPFDTVNFTAATTTVTVAVAKATPVLSIVASGILIGQALSASDLSASHATNSINGASVQGNFTFATPSKIPNVVGATNVTVNFTPTGTDANNYFGTSTTVSVDVATTLGTPSNLGVKTKPTASAISFGQTLINSILTGGVFTNSSGAQFTNGPGANGGQLVFALPGTAPAAGVVSVPVIYTPNDPNYNPLTNNINVTVTKANPVLALTAGSLTFGQALSDASLSGSTAVNPNTAASLDGAYSFTTPALRPTVGVTNVNVRFTPTDTANYNTATNKVAVTVGKAGPALTVVVANTTKFGQTLVNSLLSASKATNSFSKVSVAGAFAFSTGGIQPNAGTTNVSITFTPTDTANYSNVTATANVLVSKSTPQITTAPTATPIIVGQSLGDSTLSGGTASNTNNSSAVTGSFAFTTPTLLPTKVGTTNVNVTFTPNDANNYTLATGKVSVVVGKAPTNNVFLSTLSATPITYGQALTNSTLNGTYVNGSGANVPGTLKFANPAYVPDAGTPSVSVIFTPTNTSFKSATNPVSLTVIPAKLTIKANDAIWNVQTAEPVFTVKCTGLVPKDLLSGDINHLVGTDTAFGTNLYVWTPAENNLGALPNHTYTNFIIPVLVGLSNINYTVSYQWGNLTITNSNVSGSTVTKAAVSNGIVTSQSLAGFLDTNKVDQSGLNLVLAHYWLQTPPYISNAAFVGKTNLAFTISNFSFTVQYSTDNMSTWHDLASPARVTFTDPNAAILPSVYYRLVGSTNY